MKIRIDTVLAHSPLQSLFQQRVAQKLTVLAYHGIDNPARFAQQMAYLVERMQPISAKMLQATLDGEVSLPERAVFVTFDDGEYSVLEHGLPVLKAYGIPGAIFVVAGLLDTDCPFWWVEVEALIRAGAKSSVLPQRESTAVIRALKQVPDRQRRAIIDELRSTATQPCPPTKQLRSQDLAHFTDADIAVGNHTLTHPCLDQCDDETLSAELAVAHSHLTTRLGHAPRLFAYPNGNIDDRITANLAALGYQAAFLFDHRISDAKPADPLRISRIRVNSTTDMDRFRILVSGLHPALHHFARRS